MRAERNNNQMKKPQQLTNNYRLLFTVLCTAQKHHKMSSWLLCVFSFFINWIAHWIYGIAVFLFILYALSLIRFLSHVLRVQSFCVLFWTLGIIWLQMRWEKIVFHTFKKKRARVRSFQTILWFKQPNWFHIQ